MQVNFNGDWCVLSWYHRNEIMCMKSMPKSMAFADEMYDQIADFGCTRLRGCPLFVFWCQRKCLSMKKDLGFTITMTSTECLDMCDKVAYGMAHSQQLENIYDKRLLDPDQSVI